MKSVSEELRTVAIGLLRLADGADTSADGQVDSDTLLTVARAAYNARRQRDQLFKSEIFGEPAWDILLDLLICRLEGRAATVTNACLGSAAAHTTALRYIRVLETEGLVERTSASHDKRLQYLHLTEKGFGWLQAFFSRAIGSFRFPSDMVHVLLGI